MNLLSSSRTTATKEGRTDPWYIEWFLMCLALTALLLYSNWAIFQAEGYKFGPYRSPFYPFDFRIGRISPALLLFWIPVFFRFTCYYWRKTYYRGYFLDPAACGVNEPKRDYKGESVFPFILQNAHRYFVYLAILLLLVHWKETIASFYYQGTFGVGVGNCLLLTDSVFLTLYVFSCHALRNIIGGKLNQFSCSPCSRARYGAWNTVSILNMRHGIWAWISLVTIIVADIYIRLLSHGIINDINTWKTF